MHGVSLELLYISHAIVSTITLDVPHCLYFAFLQSQLPLALLTYSWDFITTTRPFSVYENVFSNRIILNTILLKGVQALHTFLLKQSTYYEKVDFSFKKCRHWHLMSETTKFCDELCHPYKFPLNMNKVRHSIYITAHTLEHRIESFEVVLRFSHHFV